MVSQVCLWPQTVSLVVLKRREMSSTVRDFAYGAGMPVRAGTGFL